MHKYVLKRLGLMAFTLFCIIFIVFALLNFTPGDTARLILGPNALQQDLDLFNEKFGLNDPFLTRFFNYVIGIVTRFDFGSSYRSGEPVVSELLHRTPITFNLAWASVVVSLILGVPLGIWAAVKRSTLVDHAVSIWAILIAAIPSFWLGMVMMIFFSVELKILPVFGADTWRNYVLPVACMGIPGSAGFIRLTRAVMLDTVHMEYIKTARAKGCSENIVIWKHAFKNAMLPIINGAGLYFSALLGGALITEVLFAMNGIGTYTLNALRAKDVPIVLSSTVFLSFIFCVMVLIIDLIYAFVDPRIKAKFSS